MILTANSEVVRQTRRKTGNGWLTTFIGENRNTLKQGQTPPEAGVLYPMAFLVEKEPHAVTKPHFHRGRSVSGDRAGRRPARHPRRGHRGGALHRRMVRRTDRSWQPTRAFPGSPCATPGIPARATCRPHASSFARHGRRTSQHREATAAADAGCLGRATGAHRAAVLRHGDRADAGRHGDMALSPAGRRERQRARSARRRRTVLDRAVRFRFGGRGGVVAAELLCFCRAG